MDSVPQIHHLLIRRPCEQIELISLGGTPKILVFFVGLMNPRPKQVGVLRSLFALRGALLEPVARFPAHAQTSPVGIEAARARACVSTSHSQYRNCPALMPYSLPWTLKGPRPGQGNRAGGVSTAGQHGRE